MNFLADGGVAAETAERSVLILEPDVNGHQADYLRHVIHYALADERCYVVWIVVADAVYRQLASECAGHGVGRVRLVRLGRLEEYLCRHRLLAVRGFARWWAMRRHLRSTGAASGHFLSFDYLALPFALGLGMAGRPVSGILFRPSAHYHAIGDYRPSRRERLRDFVKDRMCRLMLRNPAVRSVLTLDAYYADFAIRNYDLGEKACPVPDPAYPAINLRPQDYGIAGRLPRDRVNFVLFGFIAERKGILALIAALRLIPPHCAARTGVVVAGRIDEAIRERVEAGFRALAVERPDLWTLVENRRLADGELHALVERSAVVLAPYQRFIGSSGVLLWAAGAGRPVLTQDFGLLGRLVRDHGLGLAVDTTDPAAIAHAMQQMVAAGPQKFINISAATSFAASQTPRRFAAVVLASLLA